MNTTMYDSAIDERFEGEDAADALFASMLLEPPQWMDERILSIAHNAAIAREEEEFLRLEQISDAMFAELMIAPSPEVDKRILDLAIKLPWFTIIVKGIETVAKKLQAANDNWFWEQDFIFCSRAAAAEESTDNLSNSPGGVLHANAPPGVNSLLLGDFTLLITTNFVDPKKKNMCIMVGGERAEMYEGCIVEIRKGEAMLISGPIEFGEFEAPISVETKIEPPYTLKVRFPQDVEVVQQEILE